MQQTNSPPCFLFDNGSVRAASTLRLRQTTRALSALAYVPVYPVSLLHSTKVDPGELENEPAELLEPALQHFLLRSPTAEVVLLPFFLGPSAALTHYLPERLAALHLKYPKARLRLAHPLMKNDRGDERIAQALAESVRKIIISHGLSRPRVVLVDHGSPAVAVTEVRNFLGEQLSGLLDDEASSVAVASMERRAGPEYSYNDPLLAERLREAPYDFGDVVIALQFLSPGRHAGVGGDIAQICDSAMSERPRLRTFLTEPIGQDPRVIAVLAQRYTEACQLSFLGSISPTSSA